MFDWYKRKINKIFPIFNNVEDIELSTENDNDNNKYYLKIFSYIDEKNNNYLYAYTITKNNFTIRTNIKKFSYNSSIKILNHAIIDGLTDSIKHNIREIIVETNNYEFIENCKSKQFINIQSKFDKIEYKIISEIDNSKNYLLCENFLNIKNS